MKRVLILFAMIALAEAIPPGGCRTASTKSLPFCDMSLDHTARATDLVSRLRLSEKLSMMTTTQSAVLRLGVPAYQWGNECLHARRDSAEDLSRLKARRCTAMDWVFIPAYCFAFS